MSAGGQSGHPVSEKMSDGPVVALEGDLDIVSAEGVKRQLAALVEEGNPVVTVDMSAVDFVDSSGLGALVAVHHLASASGSQMVVRSAPSPVLSLLKLTRLDRLLTVEPEASPQ